MMPNGCGGAPGYVLRLRGLPFSCTVEQVSMFLSEFRVGPQDVVLGFGSDGKPSGEAWAAFATEHLAELALKDKQKARMGGRYIEIFRSSAVEFQRAQQKPVGSGSGVGSSSGSTKVLVLNLPSSARWQDVKDHMRQVGDVGYCEIDRPGSAVVRYNSPTGARTAVEKLDGSTFRDRGDTAEIRVRPVDRDFSPRRGQQSKSRSHSRRRSPSRSRSSRKNKSRSRSAGAAAGTSGACAASALGVDGSNGCGGVADDKGTNNG